MPKQYRKILVALDEQLLKEVDIYSDEEGISRSEFIRKAIKEYTDRKYKEKIREELKKGYIEMANINLSLAEMCFEADNDTQLCYEEKLSECEK